ncbi:DUF6197 family protein [Rhodococcus sp. Leaf233]|uniref:DUF6197 family protein n=1 Tax=Rhodococcus sp. Leaf233 TaxID=1736302 RepID=UPI00070C1922|nr:hypothetical protein [Rhodococcus sp. Leaf233]KQU33539.1 hypothetical protein ASH04_06795 [Rhodococcus sp. Leaf233]
MSTSQILADAADLIDLKGHSLDHYQTADGRLCTIGSIVLAAGGTFTYQADRDEPDDFNGPDGDDWAVTDAIAVVESVVTGLPVNSLMMPGGSLVEWNAKPDREKSDVVDALRAAAKRVAA